jgi:hypothetical protein
VLAQLPGFQSVAPDREQRIMLALRQRAMVGVDLSL